eukprot:857750-Pelagomonas_calceolata.AAC.6
MLMKFVSAGTVLGALGGRAGKVKPKTWWNLCSHTLPTAHTPGQQNLAALGGGQAGWLRPRTACKTRCKRLYSTSHCLPRPPDTAGLPRTVVWEAGQILANIEFQGQGCAGWACGAGANSTGKLADLKPHEWGFALNKK